MRKVHDRNELEVALRSGAWVSPFLQAKKSPLAVAMFDVLTGIESCLDFDDLDDHIKKVFFWPALRRRKIGVAVHNVIFQIQCHLDIGTSLK